MWFGVFGRAANDAWGMAHGCISEEVALSYQSGPGYRVWGTANVTAKSSAILPGH